MGKVWCIFGPPGSGKTTYVNACAKRGDLIVDVDSIICALGNLRFGERCGAILDYALVARNAVLNALAKRNDTDAWIISTEASVIKQNEIVGWLHAQIIILDTSECECLKRIANDPNRIHLEKDYKGLISKWHLEYRLTQSASKNVVTGSLGVYK